MKRKVAKLRLSPNEEARIIREEHERRRKLRIQQVREQQRYISLQICREVERRRQRELEQLEKDLRKDWEQQQRDKLHTLQTLYQESLQLLGQGHRSAKENEPDLEAIAQREEENNVKAEERYREAMKELKTQRLKDHEGQSRSTMARKKALQTEKERSAKVASLPKPPPHPIQSIDFKKPHVVKKSDVSAFAATHYHMPDSTVDREADTEQPSAHEGAELEVRRLQDLKKEEMRRREEQLEKARLRGKQALRREHLELDRERLLVELEHMQQTDLLRRRQQVFQMPAQIFQPLYKRQETAEDYQREMEFAFEDMYTGERRVKGDLVVQLVPEPLPALSTGSQDQELDVTQDEIPPQGAGTTQYDPEQETSVQVEPSKPAPRRALRKLLDRIRNQRYHWTEQNSHVPAAEPPTSITDQIPERDTTIDTGSLSSEEKHSLEPAPPPPALKTTEPPAAAETQLPDVLANRIKQFEEERKKRDEELEREKQQQVVLLQELEEQKAKLEQMLREAQQEREELKAAVTQEAPINQPEVPVHEQEAPSVPPELVPPAGEDEHTRRIREYQQRLLQQNSLHQRSVEVARQRLEEYQRALRIRYNMTPTSLLPAAVPPGLCPPPLHGVQSVHPPAPLQLPTPPASQAYIHAKAQTPVEVPTRESDMLASHSQPPSSNISSASKLVQDEVEYISSNSRNQKFTAWLTDNIMERVTGHLTERVRATRHSASITLQPTSDPIQGSSSIITSGAPLAPVPETVRPVTLPHCSLRTGSLSSIEDDRMERQRRVLQEVQRRELQEVQRRELQEVQRRGLQEVQRRGLQEVQRPGLQEVQRRELQEVQRRELQEVQRRELQEVQRRELQEVQRRELQEVQRRLLEQREEVALQQRQQEEERRQQEVEMEQMRRQKETLQALIQTEEQPLPEAARGVLDSESIRQTRLKLLASLLRAIEETNGGTLSHLEDPLMVQSDAPAAPASAPPSGLLPPPRAAKPPVTRVRLSIMEMMTEQHELSAIQEVETSVNTSQSKGPESSVPAPSHSLRWDLQEDYEASVVSDRDLQTPCWSSSGQQTASSPETNSSTSSHVLWRERLLMGAGTSPESSESDSILRIISPPSSDSGRGADFSGPGITSCRSPKESANRPPDSDCLSSTTISTGSYISTDPEQNISTDECLLLRRCVEPERGADSLHVFSPPGQSVCFKDSSPADRPALSVGSLSNDSSIQHIIDKYTRELNISLSTAGRTTDSEGSYVEESCSSVSQQSLLGVPERRGGSESSTSPQSLPSDWAAAQRRGLECHTAVPPVLEPLSGEEPSPAEDHEQDSFRPLIGQLTDQSSCLAADHVDSAMEQLVGQPSAHSSMIGQLPGPISTSFDHGGWDSTLSRMIGRLSHQSSSHWLSGGQDFYAAQLMGRVPLEQSAAWSEEGPERSGMRPLVGELDESAGRQGASSDERTHADLGVSTEASVPPSYPVFPPEAWPHSASPAGVSPLQQTLLIQAASPPDQGPERTEDSFHPLLAEVPHNETADSSMTFHLPDHHVPSCTEGRPHSRGEESDASSDPSVESEPSPERLRAEQPASCRAAPPLHGSFSQLITSQCHPNESEEELTALAICDDSLTVGEADKGRNSISVRGGDSVPRSDLSEGILEAAREKGILEQSEITLVSLADTTLQDPDTTEEDPHPEGGEEEGQPTEGSRSTLSLNDPPEDNNQTHPDSQCGPGRGVTEVQQQRLRALQQRSSLRVEEIKARRALAKVKPEIQGPSEAREKSKGKASPPGTLGGPRLDLEDEVKDVTPEQRKREASVMHSRTQRLYEQLEEVKHQKALRNRQEAYAKNRLKAKEFHKKTLEKLRAKKTL
ncbi:Centrosomal protein of 295 kDa [Dissostichus eleginoides]|uniref:Centrosomal protein of 295 kDa n=1 Tax=Dissostichus eleginoides TaxID=100907 RepID=A0AAD9CD36_DISEL|nr:Centrosomal protein of 295 kDa [Dissostichus eleginoides]